MLTSTRSIDFRLSISAIDTELTVEHSVSNIVKRSSVVWPLLAVFVVYQNRFEIPVVSVKQKEILLNIVYCENCAWIVHRHDVSIYYYN